MMFKIFGLAGLTLALMVTSSAAQTLRTAAQESSPKFFQLGDATVVGIGCDVMRAIERLDPTLHFTGDKTFVPMKRIQVMLERADLDVFFGFIKNEDRLGRFVFIDPPLYRTADVLLARADDPIDVQRLEDIVPLARDGIVLVASGTAQAAQLKNLHIVVDDGARTVAMNLHKLQHKRGRLVLQSEIEIVQALRSTKFEGSFRILPSRFNEQGRYVAFSRSVSEQTIAKVQLALSKLDNSGELQQIFSRYR